MKFESAIFHLSITFQRDLLATNQEPLGAGLPSAALRCGGPVASLIKILAADHASHRYPAPGIPYRDASPGAIDNAYFGLKQTEFAWVTTKPLVPVPGEGPGA